METLTQIFILFAMMRKAQLQVWHAIILQVASSCILLLVLRLFENYK